MEAQTLILGGGNDDVAVLADTTNDDEGLAGAKQHETIANVDDPCELAERGTLTEPPN